MIAAIYSRKSKFTGKGESIENQVQLCKEYATTQLKNKNITEFLIYEDEGFSGKNVNRPEFQKLMKDVKNGKFNILICYRLDRISRNVADFSSTLEVLQNNKIDFISIREQFDTSSPMGRAMIYIASVFAQLERETIAERVKDNMLELAKTGRWLGGTPPLGFTGKSTVYTDANMKERKMSKLVPVEEEIEIVKKFYSLYLEKGSLSKVHKYLYINNICTKNNAEWNIKSIQLTLRNPIYVQSNNKVIQYLAEKGMNIYGEPNGNGILTYNKRTSRDKYKDTSEWVCSISNHKGIISAEDWLKVQYILDGNKIKAPRLVSAGFGLLNGVLKCGKCGDYMYQKMGHKSIQTGELLRYYVCQKKKKSSGHRCDCKNVRLDLIEPLVLEELKKLTSDKELVLNEIELYKTSLKNNNTDSKIKLLQQEIEQKQKQMNNLIEQLSLNPSISKVIVPKIEDFNKEIDKLNNELNNLLQDNSEEKNLLNNIELVTDILLNFNTLMENADYEHQRYLIKGIVDSIFYYDDTGIVEIKLFTSSTKKKSLFNEACI